jgi:hypothetical protein
LIPVPGGRPHDATVSKGAHVVGRT